MLAAYCKKNKSNKEKNKQSIEEVKKYSKNIKVKLSIISLLQDELQNTEY